MKKEVKSSLMLILTAFVWGIAFVAQREGGDAAGPYSFNCIRSLIGAAVLLPVIKWQQRRAPESHSSIIRDRKQLWLGGIACGVLLFLASTAQQLGLYYGTSAGKAGFLTACYIIIVPLVSILLGKKCRWNVWLSVFIAVIGLYFLCLTDEFAMQPSDGLVLLCAGLFSIHILLVDYFSPQVDGVKMSSIQFLVCGVLSLAPMILVDMGHSAAQARIWLETLGTWDAWLPILYAGILSCGVGYTLQIIGQKGVPPAVASLLMSLESVFSVLAGMVILHETLTGRELLGCVLVFAAVLLAQFQKPETKSA